MATVYDGCNMFADSGLRVIPACDYQDDYTSSSPMEYKIHPDNINNLDYFSMTTNKFVTYDSSPGSISSLNEDNDEDAFVGHPNVPFDQEHFLRVVRTTLSPFSDRQDPFVALPFALDKFQEDLVLFYLDFYPKAVYGLSSTLEPHPVAADFSIALTRPACFHVILARAALYRILLGKYSSDQEKQRLEIAMVHHKGEAIKIIRKLSMKASKHHNDYSEDLLASIVSLGTLDYRIGAEHTASMHYQVVRQTLKSSGGPLRIKSTLLSRVLVYFDCIYDLTPQSYIWDRDDLTTGITNFNNFLVRMWTMWRNMDRRRSINLPIFYKTRIRNQLVDDHHLESKENNLLHTFGPKDGSCLLNFLTRTGSNVTEPSQGDRFELIFQLVTALTLCTIMLDHALDQSILQSYMDRFHILVEQSQLQEHSGSNIMWLLQVHDHSDLHSKRIWDAASWVWVLKHVNYNVQTMIKNHLLRFLLGMPLEKMFKLDSFHFSYAS